MAASDPMNIPCDERIALVIDGANLRAAARTLGFDIDFSKLSEVFQAEGRLIRAYYHAAVPDDEEFSPIRPRLLDWLEYNGFNLVKKPARAFVDSMGNRKVKRGPGR